MLPYPLEGAYRVNIEESFILVGGWGTTADQFYRDTMLKYQPESDTWLELPGKLKKGRADEPIAIVVDKAIFPACP